MKNSNLIMSLKYLRQDSINITSSSHLVPDIHKTFFLNISSTIILDVLCVFSFRSIALIRILVPLCFKTLYMPSKASISAPLIVK